MDYLNYLKKAYTEDEKAKQLIEHVYEELPRKPIHPIMINTIQKNNIFFEELNDDDDVGKENIYNPMELNVKKK